MSLIIYASTHKIFMNKSKPMVWWGMGDKTYITKFRSQTLEGENPLGRPKHRWENLK
jgi:hypothetical protein